MNLVWRTQKNGKVKTHTLEPETGTFSPLCVLIEDKGMFFDMYEEQIQARYLDTAKKIALKRAHAEAVQNYIALNRALEECK